MGGAEDIHNLWPEPTSSSAWNAHVKDALEERLHQLVCAGELDLPTAQQAIATDWITAYKKYLGERCDMFRQTEEDAALLAKSVLSGHRNFYTSRLEFTYCLKICLDAGRDNLYADAE